MDELGLAAGKLTINPYKLNINLFLTERARGRRSITRRLFDDAGDDGV